MANEQDVNTTPVSPIETPGSAPVISAAQPTPADKGDMIPSYRLKEEADKRRTAEAKVIEFEKRDKEARDKELSTTEKLNKVTEEFDTFKSQATLKELKGEFVRQAVELGFPSKIANLGAPNDLSEINMKDSLKSFTKEFSEFLPAKDPVEPAKPVNPFATLQPKASTTGLGEMKYTHPGQVTGVDAVNSLYDKK